MPLNPHVKIESATGIGTIRSGAELGVIIPAYNERSTIEELLSLVLCEKTSKQVVIVNDGSTDGTDEVIRQWISRTSAVGLPEQVDRIIVLHHRENRGKGAAIRTALPHLRAEFTVIQDADLELDPGDYQALLAPLRRGDAEIVVGFRMAAYSTWRARLHQLGVRLLNLCVWGVFRTRLRDEACCYKVLRTSDLHRMQLRCERFEFCPEIVAKASRLGLRFAEIPVRYRPRSPAGGKKLRWLDGFHAISTLWRYRHWQPAPEDTAVPTERSVVTVYSCQRDPRS